MEMISIWHRDGIERYRYDIEVVLMWFLGGMKVASRWHRSGIEAVSRFYPGRLFHPSSRSNPLPTQYVRRPHNIVDAVTRRLFTLSVACGLCTRTHSR